MSYKLHYIHRRITLAVFGLCHTVLFATSTMGTIGTAGTIAAEDTTKAKTLHEVAVSAKKNQVVYRLDRQKIDATQSLTADGGTAVDILKDIPSVSVDADGQLTLRGSSSYQVYIDGVLSPLEGTAALRAIPASSIQDIEIMTTPSARYRSDGDVGIINITTRRSRTAGLSGNVNLTGSTLGAWGMDAMLNYRQGNNTLWAALTTQEQKSRSDFQQEKSTDVGGLKTTSASDGERFLENRTLIGKIGWQWALQDRHRLSIEAQSGETRVWRGGDMTYDEVRQDITNYYDSHDRYMLKKHLIQETVDYTWNINDHSLLSATSRLRYDWFSREYTESNMFDRQSQTRFEGTRGFEDEHHWDADASLTYQNSYSTTGKVEAGYQYVTYSEHGDYRINYWDRQQSDFQWQDDLYAPFYYRRQTHSLYAIVSDRFGPVQFDAGVRAEEVIDKMSVESPKTSRNTNRLDFFPSAHIGYTAGEAGTFTLGYSHRVNRPGIWKLEPYITYEDYYTKKIGNPDLLPEFIHALELSYRKSIKDKHQFYIAGFYRHRTDVVDDVRKALEPGVTLDSILNAGKQQEYGAETQLMLKPCKWWSPTLNAMVYGYDFHASYQGCSDARGVTWQAGLNNAFTITPSTKAQFSGHYIGPKHLTQGKEHAYVFFDLALRQEFLKGKMSASIVAHDVFHTARYHNLRTAQGLRSETWVRPLYPNLSLTVSYHFNSTPKEHGISTTDVNMFTGKEF